MFEFSKEKIEGVSGATQTARAVAGGLQRSLAAELKAQAPAPSWRPRPRDWALTGVVAGAIFGWLWFLLPLARYRQNIREKNLEDR